MMESWLSNNIKENNRKEVGKIYETSLDNLKIHKLAYEHRDMLEDEYNNFKRDIELKGQLEPVLVYRGKIVDGKHRYKALKELGINTIKYIKLPNNMSIEDVKGAVMSSEKRRHDNKTQIAAKALKEYFENNISMDELSLKYPISKQALSHLNKAVEMIGTRILESLYKYGTVKVDGKNYNSINQLYKLAKKKEEELNNDNTKEDKRAQDVLQQDRRGVKVIEALNEISDDVLLIAATKKRVDEIFKKLKDEI